jgi:hypothetical protein
MVEEGEEYADLVADSGSNPIGTTTDEESSLMLLDAPSMTAEHGSGATWRSCGSNG